MGLAEVMAVYKGSNGEATTALYRRLEKIGPEGFVAVNLFRACKCSERAKLYRGGGYRGMAYDRKQWSMDNLAKALTAHSAALGIAWGWAVDPRMAADAPHRDILYIEIPTGQVSFHTGKRGEGPTYDKPWDRAAGSAPGRICQWIVQIFSADEAQGRAYTNAIRGA